MEKIALILASLLIALSPVISYATSTSSSVDALSLYNLQTNPNPIIAGENVIITFQLYDAYSYTLQNVNLQLEGSYPIINFSPTYSNLISSMGQGLYGGTNTYFTYTVTVPKNTQSGNYTIDLVATYQTTQSSTTVTGSSTLPITFYVHGIPNVSINSASSAIAPGGTFTMTLSVSNPGYGAAKSIVIDLLNTSKFSPVGTKEFVVGSLNSGGASTLSATYLASTYITNGTYSIPIQVRYYSDIGAQYNSTISEKVGVVVNNPNLVLSIAPTATSSQTLYRGYNQSLLLTIQNIGTGAAQNVSLSIRPSYGIDILSSVHNFFTGSIAPGQTAIETLLISSSNSTDNISLQATLSYLSANYRNSFSKNQTLSLYVAPSSTFSISSGAYNITPGATNMPLRLTITNTGTIDAQQVQLNFQSGYPITPVTSSYYIPELRPGQSTNVTFQVSVDSNGKPGAYPITIYETWRQPNGAVQQTYSGSNNYYGIVSNSAQATSSSRMQTYVVIGIIAILAIAVMLRRGISKKGKG